MHSDTTLLREAGLPVTDLTPVLGQEPCPLLFATVSGAHLYGFPSQDSDVDLRGVHVLPAEDLVGLRTPEETRSRMWDHDGVEMDLVTHDLRKRVRQLGGGVAGLGTRICGVVVNLPQGLGFARPGETPIAPRCLNPPPCSCTHPAPLLLPPPNCRTL